MKKRAITMNSESQNKSYLTNHREIRIEFDFHKERLTMNQVMERVNIIQAYNPDREVYMDGDTYAIVSAARVE